MERRWSARVVASFGVRLALEDGPGRVGRIGNLGLGGVFVLADPAECPLNAPVELALMLPGDDGVARPVPAGGMVVHRRSDGVGIAFDGFDGVLLRAVRSCLLAPESPPGPRLRRGRG